MHRKFPALGKLHKNWLGKFAVFLQCPEWEHCNYIVHLLTVYLQCSSSGHWFSPPVSLDHVAFLQNLVDTARFTKVFPPDFPHATRQALALPLAEPGMSRADITRHAYTLVAAGAEMTRIARLTNLQRTRMLELLGGEPVVIPTVEVEPEEFDFEGNLDGES